MLAGSLPGALLLKHVDARAIKLVFGVVVIGLGTEMLTREFSQRRARASKWMLVVIGVAAGVLCGLFGVGALLALACIVYIGLTVLFVGVVQNQPPALQMQ